MFNLILLPDNKNKQQKVKNEKNKNIGLIHPQFPGVKIQFVFIFIIILLFFIHIDIINSVTFSVCIFFIHFFRLPNILSIQHYSDNNPCMSIRDIYKSICL